MTTCGAATPGCPRAARSRSSTARITRKSWSSGCIQNPLSARGFPRTARVRAFGSAATPRSTTGSATWRAMASGSEAVLEPVQGGAAGQVPQAHRPAGEELEVLGRGRQGAPVLGRLPASILADAVGHEYAVGALVRDTGGPQVVRQTMRGRGARAHTHRA